jgi:hypothetical protein
LKLAFYHWLIPRDQSTQKAVGIKMFYPIAIQKVLDGYSTSHALRRAYLTAFPYVQRNWINPETALLILKSETDPAVTNHAFQALLERERPEAIAYLLDWVQSGLLEEADAEDLLVLKPAFSFRILDQASESHARDRLLEHLIKRVPNLEGLITKGSWIRCDAGYGKIEQIINTKTSLELPYVLSSNASILLTVVLRPGPKSEVIEIDCSERRIGFRDSDRIYICARDDCWRFMSTNQHYIIEEHNHAAHQGMGPAITHASNPIYLRSDIEFLDREPDDIFA